MEEEIPFEYASIRRSAATRDSLHSEQFFHGDEVRSLSEHKRGENWPFVPWKEVRHPALDEWDTPSILLRTSLFWKGNKLQ